MFQSVLIAVRLSVVACFAVIIALTVAPVRVLAQQEHFDALANAPFSENRPTPETSKLLKEELLFQRATQTYLWALPLINTLGMKAGSEKTFGAGYNILPVWKKRLDAKTLVTTPNSDVIYAMSYLDLGKDGPMVFEAPPGLQGPATGRCGRPCTRCPSCTAPRACCSASHSRA